jgi:hypothetical protein
MGRRALKVIGIGGVLTCLLAGAGWVGLDAQADRWAWRRADLDRNRLNLATYRGAETGEQFAGWVEEGTVVSHTGRSQRAGGGDMALMVRYDQGEPPPWSVATPFRDRFICYRFTTDDGFTVAFGRVGCPPGPVPEG